MLDYLSKTFRSNLYVCMFQVIITPQRAVRGLQAIRNVEESEVPNAPEVQPQGKVTNTKLREAIWMLIQGLTNQVGQQARARQEEAKNLRIHEFLRINPPSSLVQSPLRIQKTLWKN